MTSGVGRGSRRNATGDNSIIIRNIHKATGISFLLLLRSSAPPRHQPRWFAKSNRPTQTMLVLCTATEQDLLHNDELKQRQFAAAIISAIKQSMSSWMCAHTLSQFFFITQFHAAGKRLIFFFFFYEVILNRYTIFFDGNVKLVSVNNRVCVCVRHGVEKGSKLIFSRLTRRADWSSPSQSCTYTCYLHYNECVLQTIWSHWKISDGSSDEHSQQTNSGEDTSTLSIHLKQWTPVVYLFTVANNRSQGVFPCPVSYLKT